MPADAVINHLAAAGNRTGEHLIGGAFFEEITTGVRHGKTRDIAGGCDKAATAPFVTVIGLR